MKRAFAPPGDLGASAAALLFYSAFFSAVFHKSLLSDLYIAPSDALDFGVSAYLSSPSLWTQGMYSGYPIAADPQSLMWYPILQLFRVLGFDWNSFMVSAFVLASTTCFLLVRRLTASNVAALFAGIVFGFGAPMLGNIGHFNQLHAVAWMPLVVYGLQLIREGGYRRGFAIGSAAFSLMWLAGHPQIPAYTAYMSAALVIGGIVIDQPNGAISIRRLWWSAGVAAMGVGLAAVMIAPMVELSSLGDRGAANWDLYTAKPLPPWQLLTLILPTSFGFWAADGQSVPYIGDGTPGENLTYLGVLPLALMVVGWRTASAYRSDIRLWICIGIVALLLCLGGATPMGTLFFYAPAYARFRVPSRHLFVVALCAAVASGYVMAYLLEQRGAARKMLPTLGATVVFGVAGFAVFALTTPAVRALIDSHREYAAWTLGWPAAVAAALSIPLLVTSRWTAPGLPAMACGMTLLAAQAADLAIIHYRVPGYRYEYADIGDAQVWPQPRIAALRQELQRNGQRVLAVDGTHNRYLLPNLTRPWQINAASGSGPLGIGRYTDLMQMGGPGDVGHEILGDAHQELDLLSIGYVLVPTASPLATELEQKRDRWTEIDRLSYEDDPDSQYTLFRNGRARRRAWCAGTLATMSADDQRTAIRTGRLGDGSAFDPASVALAEPDAFPGWTSPAGTSESAPDVQVQLGSEARYVVNTDMPCLLVLSEVYYPWWRASVDDKPADVAQVNYAMAGVSVPAGSHIVRLWLRPLTVWIGGAVSLTCLVIWFVILALTRPARPSEL